MIYSIVTSLVVDLVYGFHANLDPDEFFHKYGYHFDMTVYLMASLCLLIVKILLRLYMFFVLKAFVAQAEHAADLRALRKPSSSNDSNSSSELLYKEVDGNMIAYYKAEYEIKQIE